MYAVPERPGRKGSNVPKKRFAAASIYPEIVRILKNPLLFCGVLWVSEIRGIVAVICVLISLFMAVRSSMMADGRGTPR